MSFENIFKGLSEMSIQKSSHELGQQLTIYKKGLPVIHFVSPILELKGSLDVAEEDGDGNVFKRDVFLETDVVVPLLTHFKFDSDDHYQKFSPDDNKELIDFAMESTNSYVALIDNHDGDSAVEQYIAQFGTLPPEIDAQFRVPQLGFGSTTIEVNDDYKEFFDIELREPDLIRSISLIKDSDYIMSYLPDGLKIAEDSGRLTKPLPDQLSKDFGLIASKSSRLFQNVRVGSSSPRLAQ
jgi:hypothetical protein